MQLYPSNILDKLEFTAIQELLFGHCRSVLGKRKVEEMSFSTDADWIRQELMETDDYKRILLTQSYFPLDFIIPLDREIAFLGIGNAVLVAEEIINIRKTCLTMDRIFRFFKNNLRLYPHLQLIVEHTVYEKAIVETIDHVMEETGHVRDKASKDLYDIRTRLSKRRSELSRVFQKVLQRMNKEGVVTDVEQTFLNGRKVVAVFAENKRQISGIIHGQSETGKTSYIEPAETVELNNEIFELEREEEREVTRILRQLTSDLSVYRPLIIAYQAALAKFDYVQAKAKLSVQLNAVCPIVHQKPGVRLKDAMHPLLYKHNLANNKPTIPLNLFLNDRRILVISGPNAGGKTVAMKTVALLQLMVQSGLLVPCHELSEFGVFYSMFIDIGDAQSIEYELSTYSSHLKTVKYFLDYSSDKTLFLIDELGTGSDPALGGAFAEVVLEELAKRKAYGIVTTHYLNLKILANKNAAILNGAMAFDEENLQPLYALKLGKPGSSYTFQIAKRSGLPQPMIDRAKTLVNNEHVELDFLLSKLEQESKRIKQKEEELKRKDDELNQLQERYTQLHERVKKQQQQQADLQKKYANQKFIREAERELRKLLIDWQKAQTAEEKKTVAKKTEKTIRLEEPKELAKKEQKIFDLHYRATPYPPKVGSMVRIVSLDKIGTLVQLGGKKVQVAVGDIQVSVKPQDIVVVERVNT